MAEDVGGQPLHEATCYLLKSNRIGNTDEAVLWHERILGIITAHVSCIGYTVAHLELSHICADHFDDTRRYIDGVSWLTAADRQQIFEGNARRVYGRLDARLAAAARSGRPA